MFRRGHIVADAPGEAVEMVGAPEPHGLQEGVALVHHHEGLQLRQRAAVFHCHVAVLDPDVLHDGPVGRTRARILLQAKDTLRLRPRQGLEEEAANPRPGDGDDEGRVALQRGLPQAHDDGGGAADSEGCGELEDVRGEEQGAARIEHALTDGGVEIFAQDDEDGRSVEAVPGRALEGNGAKRRLRELGDDETVAAGVGVEGQKGFGARGHAGQSVQLVVPPAHQEVAAGIEGLSFGGHAPFRLDVDPYGVPHVGLPRAVDGAVHEEPLLVSAL